MKGPNVIKGIHLEGLRVVGDPSKLATKYYEEGVDELLYMDAVASLYGRNNLFDVVHRAASQIFVPLTVGGGVRTIDDILMLLKAGADKVAINSAAVRNPKLIEEASQMFGSQCVVLSIEAKRISPNKWEVYLESGREPTGKDVIEWAKEAVSLGAGEIIVTSIDQEGTKKGFDEELVKSVARAVSVPVIACGGCGSNEHAVSCFLNARPDAIAVASAFHYGITDVAKMKDACAASQLPMRM